MIHSVHLGMNAVVASALALALAEVNVAWAGVGGVAGGYRRWKSVLVLLSTRIYSLSIAHCLYWKRGIVAISVIPLSIEFLHV